MSRATTAFDAWAWAQEARRRCESVGVALVFDPETPGPCTDGHTIRIPPVPANATPDDLTVLRHAVIHECGHHLRPEVFTICKREKLKQDSPLMALFNIIEDAAQERATAEKWRGDCASMADGHRTICARQIASASDEVPGDVSPAAHKLAAAMAASLVAASDWSRDMETMTGPWSRALDKRMPGTSALFETLKGEDWPQRIRDARSVNDAWRVANELFTRLFPDETPESQKQPDEADGGGGEDGDGKGKPGDAKSAAGRAERGEGKGKPVSGGVIPWELIYHSDHTGEGTDSAAAMPTRIDWTGKPTGGAPVWHTSKTVETPKPSAHAVAIASAFRFPPGLVGEVRRLLQARSRVRWDHERLAGRLDRRNLTRVIMPRVGDGTYNRSVFQRRAESLSLDVCVTVLVDCSGSMSACGKYENAAAAAVCLNELADVSLKVPCEIVGFTTGAGLVPRYYEFKTYAERRLASGMLGARFQQVRDDHALCGNADGDAVLWAASRMRSRREARKILIVLSDGSPTDGAGGADADVNLTAAIRAVREGGAVEVYGVGIMDSNVRRYYSPKAPVIATAAEMPAALVEVLSDVLQRKPA